MRLLARVLLVNFLALLIFSPLYAENISIMQTKLQQLDKKIASLKQLVDKAADKRGLLNRELANTEKQIGEGVRQLTIAQQGIALKQEKIKNIEQHINVLNQQLNGQQQLLAEHVRAYYQMGEYQPLKWLLNQEDPFAITRLLTFYEYLVKSRQAIIQRIDESKTNLTTDYQALQTTLNEQQILQKRLNKHQQRLKHNKAYHTAVLQALNNEIQTKRHVLFEYEANKKNLANLLTTFVSQRLKETTQPFSQARRKLPYPVPEGKLSLQKINQGIAFYASEGTAVKAVYPGKVVFSDWLNGYGLLLILDHGQGFMTLYAHNQSLFKQKGSFVHQGEQIAAVGHSGGIKENGLYFEIRLNGKTVPPLDWLA